jgi:hypothetical protein
MAVHDHRQLQQISDLTAAVIDTVQKAEIP